MTVYIGKWNDVNVLLPKDSEWKIVRCINSDVEYSFYFMAMYDCEDKIWNFFDDDYDDCMQVTHWQKEPLIPFNIEFTLKVNK